MAAVPEDEESLLASGRALEDPSRRFGKAVMWQDRYRSLFQTCGIRTRFAAFMALAALAIVTALWILYVYHLCSSGFCF